MTLFDLTVGDMMNESILGRAQERDIIRIEAHQIRDYTLNKQKQVDDYPYGGGHGAVMQADPLYQCWKHIVDTFGPGHTIYMSPAGKTFVEADARRLRQRLEAGDVRSVTVIGASMVGIKIVELCREAGIACTLADLAERVFPLAALPDVSAEIQRRLAQPGVALRFGAAVTRAEESARQVTTWFAQGEAVTSDLLVLCIGTRARTELARAAGLEVDRGIVVDDSMQTSAPGIYAAGDCCQGREIMSGGHQIIGLWANAAYQGQTAGHCMAGDPVIFSGNILHNITHFMGMDFVGFGDVRTQGEVHRVGRPTDRRYIEAVVADGELRCVNLLDSYHISGVVKNYLMNRFTGNRAPLPTALRGLLAREGFTDEFLSLFEGEAET